MRRRRSYALYRGPLVEFFAYVDESGDIGPKGSKSYVLAAVLVEMSAWPATFDDLIHFRRALRAQFGIPVRAEIKANYLLRNGGPLRPLALSESARYAVYRAHMRLHSKLELQTFAVVIRKDKLLSRHSPPNPRDVAWEYLLQRLERFTTKGRHDIMVVHDEGDSAAIRKLARKARRAGSAGSAFGTGSLSRPATRLLDDPVPRDSRQSYFLQLADLAAYAAFRKEFPPPVRPGLVVPATMWDELGSARYTPVSSLQGRTDAIVAWP